MRKLRLQLNVLLSFTSHSLLNLSSQAFVHTVPLKAVKDAIDTHHLTNPMIYLFYVLLILDLFAEWTGLCIASLLTYSLHVPYETPPWFFSSSFLIALHFLCRLLLVMLENADSDLGSLFSTYSHSLYNLF